VRVKRPDVKNAQSIAEAAIRDMAYTLSIKPNLESGSTIIRNVYECFRMLGDALLTAKGFESHDHIAPIKELLTLKVHTTRPTQLIEQLRTLRHNINYYGYRPAQEDIDDTISLAKACFGPLSKETLRQIKRKQ
jgi:hypothetical protein